ncbi:MAG: addiction module toxin, HicA family [Dehalococcoidia bacterium]|nr:addiction module toxin, HicA family [Dehalococcoidia bacterium]
MNRTQILRHLHQQGCAIWREVAKHTIILNTANGQVSAVPRHREVNVFLATKICRDLGITPLR